MRITVGEKTRARHIHILGGFPRSFAEKNAANGGGADEAVVTVFERSLDMALRSCCDGCIYYHFWLGDRKPRIHLQIGG